MRAPTARTTQGPSPAPTSTCSVQGGQWKKSHGPEPPLLPLDQEQALAREDEEPLLVLLAVVHAARLPGREDGDVEPDLGEAHVALERGVAAEDLVLPPAGLARVDDEPALALRARGRSPSGRALPPRPCATSSPDDGESLGSRQAHGEAPPDGLAPGHRGGLAGRVRGRPRPARPAAPRRRDARALGRADPQRALRPALEAGLHARDRPALLVVRPPARVAEEDRAHGRRLPVEQPVHVPGHGEARGLLRDDAARPACPGDVAPPAQAPARQPALRADGRALQPGVRPRRGSASGSATRST